MNPQRLWPLGLLAVLIAAANMLSAGYYVMANREPDPAVVVLPPAPPKGKEADIKPPPQVAEDSKPSKLKDGSPKTPQTVGPVVIGSPPIPPAPGDSGTGKPMGKEEKLDRVPPPPEKRRGDLLILVVDTEHLRRAEYENFQAQLAKLRHHLQLGPRLLGGQVYLTQRRQNLPWWNAGLQQVGTEGEVFGRGEFKPAFDAALEDVGALTAQAERPADVKAVLVWWSDFNLDDDPSPVTLAVPKSVRQLVWLGTGRESKRLKMLFAGVSRPVVQGLTDTIEAAVE